MSSSPQEVTVTPSDVRAFATVLDDLTELLRRVRSEVLATHSADFGEYANSGAAADRYHRAVTQRATALDHLVTTSERFTDGTVQLAKDYDNVSELNAARAQAVTTALGTDR